MAFSFGKIKAEAEKHPYWTAGIIFVVGVIIIYWWYSGSSSSSGSTASAAGQTAAAEAAIAASNNQLAAAQLESQTQLGEASIGANAANTQTAAELSLGEEQLSTSLAATQSNNDTAVSLANVQAQEAETGAWVAEQGNEYAEAQQTAQVEYTSQLQAQTSNQLIGLVAASEGKTLPNS